MDKRKLKEILTAAVKSDAAGPHLRMYLQLLSDNAHAVERRFLGQVGLVFGLAFAFELTANASVAEMSVGPIVVTDFSLIQKLLPLALAYAYHELVSLATMRRMLGISFCIVMEQVAPPLAVSGLDKLVAPSSPFITEDLLDDLGGGYHNTRITGVPLKFALILMPVFFLVYAYVRCFIDFGGLDWALWLSLLASGCLLFQAARFWKRLDEVT